MTPVLVALAVLVVAGAVAAVAASTPRLAVLGLFVALVGGAYVADPLPGIVGLVARLAGSTLGALLVWIALRGAPAAVPRSTAGWPGSAAIAVAAFVAGWLAATGLGEALAAGATPGAGAGTSGAAGALAAGSPVARAAVAAAFALIALALPQVTLPRDTLRLGTACLLLLAAAGLLANALVGQLDPVVELALGLLTALGGAGAAAVVVASVRQGGDLVIRDARRPDAAVRHRAPDDAHRSRPPTAVERATSAPRGDSTAAGERRRSARSPGSWRCSA